jgi:hypothetical protein
MCSCWRPGGSDGGINVPSPAVVKSPMSKIRCDGSVVRTSSQRRSSKGSPGARSLIRIYGLQLAPASH